MESGRWNLSFNSAQMLRLGNATDFVIARGTPTPLSGMVWRQSGTTSGSLEYLSDLALILGAPTPLSFPTGSAIRVLAFQAPTAGNYDIAFPTGTASLQWRLFDPGSAGQWRRSDDSIANGTLSALPTTVALGAGLHALAVFGEPGPVAPGTTCTVRVCETPVPVTLTQGVGANLSSVCASLAHTPEAGVWNAIALVTDPVGAADLYISLAVAAQPGLGQCELVVANGHGGVISPTPALAVRTSTLGTVTV